MRLLSFAGALCALFLSGLVGSTLSAQSPLLESVSAPNPECLITEPRELGRFRGKFKILTRNFAYIPELATNPVEDFAIGTNNDGTPLLGNEGHFHGWVFRLDFDLEELFRHDDFPTPGSYLRFYGAPALTEVEPGVFELQDEFEPGLYKAYFQIQRNDHTAITQATAPALPAIDSVVFYVLPDKKGKGRGRGKGRRKP